MSSRLCTIVGCAQTVFARGWCQKHWTRWRRHGDPEFSLKRMDMSPLERFLQQVEITDTCWLWVGAISKNGYAQFSGEWSAHRWSYRTFVGPIPAGFQVDHTCHNADLSCRGLGAACPHRKCCNPDHLEAVPATENIRRVWSGRTECRHGHPWVPDNLRVRFHAGHGRVIEECRTCIRNQARAKNRSAA